MIGKRHLVYTHLARSQPCEMIFIWSQGRLIEKPETMRLAIAVENIPIALIDRLIKKLHISNAGYLDVETHCLCASGGADWERVF